MRFVPIMGEFNNNKVWIWTTVHRSSPKLKPSNSGLFVSATSCTTTVALVPDANGDMTNLSLKRLRPAKNVATLCYWVIASSRRHRKVVIYSITVPVWTSLKCSSRKWRRVKLKPKVLWGKYINNEREAESWEGSWQSTTSINYELKVLQRGS